MADRGAPGRRWWRRFTRSAPEAEAPLAPGSAGAVSVATEAVQAAHVPWYTRFANGTASTVSGWLNAMLGTGAAATGIAIVDNLERQRQVNIAAPVIREQITTAVDPPAPERRAYAAGQIESLVT